MQKENFTVSRVNAFKCEDGKQQTIFWDAKTPGLGVRVTAAGASAYIFESRLFGKTIRITLGDTRSWKLDKAQLEAARLKTLIGEGKDPREVKEEQRTAHAARQTTKQRQNVVFGEAWAVYVEARKPHWGERSYLDHVRHADPGGQPKQRGRGLTTGGPLGALLDVRLADLTSEQVAAWLATQKAIRPTMVALSYRLLRGFIRWAGEMPAYRDIIPADAYQARSVKETLPRAKTKEGDCLQREQLPAWFKAVRAIGNPVVSAYLQGLLITGARREELGSLRWEDVDFEWRSLSLKDKVETDTGRVIPLPPYLLTLLQDLKRRNEILPSTHQLARLQETDQAWAPSPWVFASGRSADGKLADPRTSHVQALKAAGLPHISLHGLRRSFGTLAEWVECPAGVVAQIQGHKPSAIAEKHYRRRPLDLLRLWHDRIELWMLEQAGITFNTDL